MIRSVDNRTQTLRLGRRADQTKHEFTISPDTFLALKKASDLEGLGLDTRLLLEAGLQVSEMNADDLRDATSVLLRAANDLETNAMEVIHSLGVFERVMPVLQTQDGDLRPADLGNIIVGFFEDSAVARARFAVKYGLVLRRYDKAGKVAQFRILEGSSLEEVLAEISVDDQVRYAEPDFIVTGDDFARQSEEASTELETSDELWNHKLVNLSENTQYDGSTRVAVAVVDGRSDLSHPLLKGAIVPHSDQLDFAPEHTPPSYFKDHGTAVCGVVAASNGMGISPFVDLFPISICTDSSMNYLTRSEALNFLSQVASSRRWKPRGSNISVPVERLIVNCSWRTPNPMPIVIEDSIQRLSGSGVLIFCSAGNANRDSEHYPSDMNECLSVASVNSEGTKSASSNFSDKVDFSAPGGGKSISNPAATTQDVPSLSFGGGTSFYNGTSFAAPHASAVAAIVWANHPQLKANELRELLLSSMWRPHIETNTDYDSKMGIGIVSLSGLSSA